MLESCRTKAKETEICSARKAQFEYDGRLKCVFVDSDRMT